MANFFNTPDISPFRFLPVSNTFSPHFGEDWACAQIRDFERKVHYRQKWKQSDTTLMQIESTILPSPLEIMNPFGVVVKTITWAPVFDAVIYKVYECTVDFTGVPVGIYFLHQKVTLLDINWATITEPIEVKTDWANTMLIKYKHSFNDYGVSFSTGIIYSFRVESGIVDYTPERERTAHVNQISTITTLKGQALRTFKYVVGTALGVAPWVVDVLNHIFICDYISLEGKLYESTVGSKWEVTRVKGYPLIGASIEIAPKYTNSSLQFNNNVPLAGGIVTAYNIETSFFGPGAQVPVLDLQNQS